MRSRLVIAFLLLLMVAALLLGCGNFFVSNKNTPGVNGQFVFLADASDVQSFTIGTNGALTLQGTTGFSGGATAIGADGGGHFVYVSTSSGIVALLVDRTHGTTATITGSPFSSTLSFSWVAVDPSARFVYGASGSSVLSFTVNPTTGALSLVGSPLVLPATVQKMMVDPSGRFLFVADGGSGVAVMAIGTNGALGAPTLFTSTHCTAAFDVAIDPAFHFAYTVDGTTNICMFSLASTTGAMTELTGSPVTTGTGAVAINAEPTGHFVFVVNKTAATATPYVIHSDGTLALAGTAVAAGTLPVELDTDPQGQFLYVVDNAGNVRIFNISLTGVIGPAPTGPSGTAPVGIVTTP